MAVKIRMKKISSTAKGRYNFRIVAIDESSARDSVPLEELGYYNPAADPASFKIDRQRYEYWISKGAQPSDTVASLYKKSNKQEAQAAKSS